MMSVTDDLIINSLMDSAFYHFLLDIMLVSASVLYPIWQSLKVLEVKKYEKALIQWLAYWIIYAVFWKAESLVMTLAYDFLDG
jgi:hypothetical protein